MNAAVKRTVVGALVALILTGIVGAEYGRAVPPPAPLEARVLTLEIERAALAQQVQDLRGQVAALTVTVGILRNDHEVFRLGVKNFLKAWVREVERIDREVRRHLRILVDVRADLARLER